MDLFAALEDWPVRRLAAAAIDASGDVRTFGDPDEPFALASVTKLITALAVLVAHEEGTIDLDEVITDAGATTADLLAHAGGLGFDSLRQIARPHVRRIYSSTAYDLLGEIVGVRAEMRFPAYVQDAVLAPLGMSRTEVSGSPGAGAVSTITDLLRLSSGWTDELVVHRATLHRAVTPHLPDLAGVVPGFGRQSPNPWGLGPEIRGRKAPHWTGTLNSATTFGHFGQSGTFVWIDPEAGCTLAVLTDEPFGPWAADRWPRLADTVLRPDH
ncbi:MAG: serine hydrolase domain-containing protein [Acidimicrobiales bacterium]